MDFETVVGICLMQGQWGDKDRKHIRDGPIEITSGLPRESVADSPDKVGVFYRVPLVA